MQPLFTPIITEIAKPFVVQSPYGREQQIVNREYYGLSLCISGQITYTIHGKQIISLPGTAVLLPKNGTYTLHCDKSGLFPVINFQCQNDLADTIHVFQLDNPEICIKSFEKLQNLFLFPNTKLARFSLFYEILNQVLSVENASQTPLHPAMQYLQQHCFDPDLSNARLAHEAQISEVYLRKLFLSLYGTTPRQYILELRLKRAKQLLSDTDYTVSKIADTCGFSSVYHFCRTFKDRIGVTPTEYAKSNRIHQI